MTHFRNGLIIRFLRTDEAGVEISGYDCTGSSRLPCSGLAGSQGRAELAQDPDNRIKKYRAVFAEGKGVAWPKRDSFNEKKDIKVTTAEEWMRENLRS